jgi:hypothetical protein
MTFELVRWGWPNTAAILALAVMPIMASVAAPQPNATTAPVAPAAICLTQAECHVVAADAAAAELLF